MRLGRKYLILITCVPFFLILDQWTKWLILENFHLYRTRSVIEGFFNLTYIRNTGAAFGLLAEAAPALRVPLFLIMPVVALGIIAYLFKKLPRHNVKLALALSFIISGALGNLIDRFRLGYVVDFLDFHWKYQKHFPAFNVADSVICVGVGILMLDLFFGNELESGFQPDKKPSAEG